MELTAQRGVFGGISPVLMLDQPVACVTEAGSIVYGIIRRIIIDVITLEPQAIYYPPGTVVDRTLVVQLIPRSWESFQEVRS